MKVIIKIAIVAAVVVYAAFHFSGVTKLLIGQSTGP